MRISRKQSQNTEWNQYDPQLWERTQRKYAENKTAEKVNTTKIAIRDGRNEFFEN